MPYDPKKPPPPPPRVRPPQVTSPPVIIEEVAAAKNAVSEGEHSPLNSQTATTSPLNVKPLPPVPPQKPFRPPSNVEDPVIQIDPEFYEEGNDVPYYDGDEQPQDQYYEGEDQQYYDENQQAYYDEQIYYDEEQQAYYDDQQQDGACEQQYQTEEQTQESQQEAYYEEDDQQAYYEDQTVNSCEEAIIEEPIVETSPVSQIEEPNRPPPPIPVHLDIIEDSQPKVEETVVEESIMEEVDSKPLESDNINTEQPPIEDQTTPCSESSPPVSESIFSVFDSTTLNPLPSLPKKSLSKRPQRKERSRECVDLLFKKADTFFEQHVEIDVKEFSKEEEIPETKTTPMKPQPMFMMNQSMLEGIKLKKSSTPIVLKKAVTDEDESSVKKEETPKKPSWALREKTPLAEEKTTPQAPPWASALKKKSTNETTSDVSATPTKTEPSVEGKKSLFERKFNSDDLSSPSSGKLKPTIFGSPHHHSATLPAGFSISKFKKAEEERKKQEEETETKKVVDETNTEAKNEESPKCEETKSEKTEENKSEEGPSVVEREKEEPKDDLSPVITPKKAESFRFATLGSPMLRQTESPFVTAVKDEGANDTSTSKGSLKDKLAMLEKKQVAQAPPAQVDFRSVLKKRPANQ